MSELARAISILRSGGLVAFPTETVYGLGADATNAEAVRKIFAVKGRPGTNPLICHVADMEVAQRYARVWPDVATQLAKRFWPGPLTLVLPKMEKIVPEVSAGRDTVGLRAPDHPLALELLRAFGKPLAGPSANKSNHVSPTTARHVRNELGDEVELILDGGPCAVGIESTVLDLSCDHPMILRPGGVSREQIEETIGPVDAKSIVADVTMPAMSPGQHPVHYAPCTPAFRFESIDTSRIPSGASVIRVTATPDDYARRFYATLRDLDAAHPDAIYIEMPPDSAEWTAVRDRILRATRPVS